MDSVPYRQRASEEQLWYVRENLSNDYLEI